MNDHSAVRPRLWTLLLLLVTGLVWACGDSDSPTSATAPVDGTPERSAPSAGPSENPATDEGTDGAVDADPPVQFDPLPAPDLGVQVGTEPPFHGSLYTASTFPRNELITVLAKDAIPSITDPQMVRQDDVPYLSDDDLVFGVVIDSDARAYPHNIGWWHEIVNDIVGGQPIAVTFCPLTGTGLVFDGADGSGGRVSFGVSGLLYNTNLVMFSRINDTLYPQIFASGISGPHTGKALRLLPVVETTWATWKRLYPSTLVIADGPYRTSRYSTYPYSDYRTNNGFFLFPVRPSASTNPNPATNRFDSKERVLGIRVEGETMAFPYSSMGTRRVIHETIGELDVAVVWDRSSQLVLPYARQVNGQTLTFDIVEDGAFPFNLRDQETGTLWNIKGQAIEGELQGTQLTHIPAHSSMWFAWVSFWPSTAVWSP